MTHAAPGWRWIHKGELLEEHDLGWGLVINGRHGWGLMPPWLIGKPYHPEDGHPPLAIRRIT